MSEVRSSEIAEVRSRHHFDRCLPGPVPQAALLSSGRVEQHMGMATLQQHTGSHSPTGSAARSSTPAHAKRVVVVRHGQAEHNVDQRAIGKRDVQLTERGRMQCEVIRDRIANLGVEAMVTSPVLRALQTTHTIAPNVPVVVAPDARECWVCDEYVCEAPMDASNASRVGPFAGYDWSVAVGAAAAAAAMAEEAAKAPKSTKAKPMTGKAAAAATEAAVRAAIAGLSAWEEEMMKGDLKVSWMGDCSGLRARGKRLADLIRRRPEHTICLVSHASFLNVLTSSSSEDRMDNCVRSPPDRQAHHRPRSALSHAANARMDRMRQRLQEIRVYELSVRGRWRRIEMFPSPTTEEIMDVGVQKRAQSGGRSPPISPPLMPTEGGHVFEAEGRVRGGATIGLESSGPGVPSRGSPSKPRSARNSREHHGDIGFSDFRL